MTNQCAFFCTGIPVQKNTESLLAIHKDFAGEWATEKDKVYYDSVLSGEDMTVYLSIIDLGTTDSMLANTRTVFSNCHV